jgi:peptidoglycan/LPS O-acetylase OafA/YrhL
VRRREVHDPEIGATRQSILALGEAFVDVPRRERVRSGRMTGTNRKCVASGLIAVALAVVIVLLFVDARLADRQDANIGGGLVALALMGGIVYYGINGRRETREQHQRGEAIAVASLAFVVAWVAVVIVGASLG